MLGLGEVLTESGWCLNREWAGVKCVGQQKQIVTAFGYWLTWFNQHCSIQLNRTSVTKCLKSSLSIVATVTNIGRTLDQSNLKHQDHCVVMLHVWVSCADFSIWRSLLACMATFSSCSMSRFIDPYKEGPFMCLYGVISLVAWGCSLHIYLFMTGDRVMTCPGLLSSQ